MRPPVVVKSGRSFDFEGVRVRMEGSAHSTSDRVPELVEWIVEAIRQRIAASAPDEVNEPPFKIAVTAPGEVWAQTDGKPIRMAPSAPDEVNEAQT